MSEIINPNLTLNFPKVYITSPPQNIIGSRIELSESIGVVRYCGPLKHKQNANPNEIWVGVEWEDPSRGKHNGTVEGFEYFKTTSGGNNGSLVKLSKVNVGQNLTDAIDFKYNFYNKDTNHLHQFIDSAIEGDNFIQANKKKINIELVGKDKAIKEFSALNKMICADLTNSYVSIIGDVKSLLPRIQELVLTKTLLRKWSDMVSLLENFPLLTLLNFSENPLEMDEEFEKKLSELKHTIRLDTLVLNKCKIDIYKLIKLSPLFKTVENLYLLGNELNKETYEAHPQKSYIDEKIDEIRLNTPKLKMLSVERNRIRDFFYPYEIFRSPLLRNLNMNQNLISEIFKENESTTEEELGSNEIFQGFKKTITHLSIDYNKFPLDKFSKIFKEVELFGLADIDILNNNFIEKKIDQAKIELIGRNPTLKILNNTTITGEMRRDNEKYYLKQSVQSYFDIEREVKITNQNFDLKDFEAYMTKNHPKYFTLKKKYFDPLDEFVNLLKKKDTNAIKGNMVEVVLTWGTLQLKKKFPKSTQISNLRNLCSKLFKMPPDEVFNFYLKHKSGKEEQISDESTSLVNLEMFEEDVIALH